MKKYTLLTFDVEEFDIPLEYNQKISMDEQMETGLNGLKALLPIWEKYNIASTLFTTANFGQTFPSIIKDLSNRHEIASHTFYHSSFTNADLLASKQTLERITDTTITGLRMPRMRNVEMKEVIDAGYLYDSSVNPTFLPGRYNNFHLPRSIYKQQGMIRVPASVSPFIRLPLFWLGFKNYPYSLFKKLCFQTLKKDGYLSLYFHPWEFTDISKYNLPGYVIKPDASLLLNRLEKLINDLLPHTHFITMNDYLLLKNYLKN
jgi:peptidoglycan/xylan/chitin deacetylase (PgdA/CDA1 family)